VLVAVVEEVLVVVEEVEEVLVPEAGPMGASGTEPDNEVEP
jgi:hypothetical protein